MSRFNVGDRIVVTGTFCCARCGMTGTVIHVFPINHSFHTAVEFDIPFEGAHSCGSRCDRHVGQFMVDDVMELIDDEPQNHCECDDEVRFY